MTTQDCYITHNVYPFLKNSSAILRIFWLKILNIFRNLYFWHFWLWLFLISKVVLNIEVFLKSLVSECKSSPWTELGFFNCELHLNQASWSHWATTHPSPCFSSSQDDRAQQGPALSPGAGSQEQTAGQRAHQPGPTLQHLGKESRHPQQPGTSAVMLRTQPRVHSSNCSQTCLQQKSRCEINPGRQPAGQRPQQGTDRTTT